MGQLPSFSALLFLLLEALFGLFSGRVNVATGFSSPPQEKPAYESGTPKLPTATVNAALPDLKGYQSKTVCSKGCDFTSLHAAISAASCGTVLNLRAGETFTETEYSLPSKRCDETHWIVIQTDAAAKLPPPGTRVQPGDSQFMAKLISASRAVSIQSASGANHYRFIGLEVTNNSDNFSSLMYLGTGQPSDTSTRIIVDRCYVHGMPKLNSNRGIILTANNSAIVDSYISEIHSTTSGDTQAVLLPGNGQGPYLLQNNFLESAGENVLMGGGGTGNSYDVTIVGNWFFKPASWYLKSPDYAGTHWGVKNILEFKAAVRVLVQGNVFENVWSDAQNGTAILLTPRSSQNPGALVDDVTINQNLVQHAAVAWGLAAWDGEDHAWNGETKGPQAHRITINNNIFDDIGGSWTNESPVAAFAYYDGPADLHVTHNTFVNTGIAAKTGYLPQATGCIFNDNILQVGLYGWVSPDGGAAPGSAAILHSCGPKYSFSHNALVGGPNGVDYPKTTVFPKDWQSVGFVNYKTGATGDLRLCIAKNEPAQTCKSASPLYHAGSDGKDIGANPAEVMAAALKARGH